jgi:hypothetical protein
MVKINLTKLQEEIKVYVNEYYGLKEKPQLKELDPELVWVKDMIKRKVWFAVSALELEKTSKISVLEKNKESCLTKKKYEVINKLNDDMCTKFVLKGNKVAKVNLINLWAFKQRNEMKDTIENTFQLTKKACEIGLGPKVYDTFVCLNEKEDCAYYVIVTENIRGMLLEEWLKLDHTPEERQQVHDMVNRKIDLMHEHGIVHNSLWSSNIILKMSRNKVLDIYITNFMRAYELEHMKNTNINEDKWILEHIKNERVDSYSNADDVVQYVAIQLLAKKGLVIE